MQGTNCVNDCALIVKTAFRKLVNMGLFWVATSIINCVTSEEMVNLRIFAMLSSSLIKNDLYIWPYWSNLCLGEQYMNMCCSLKGLSDTKAD